VSADAVRTRLGTDVRRLRPHRQPVVGEGVLDAEHEREGVPGSRVEPMRENRAVGRALGDRPLRPAHEPVNRVPSFRLVERKLMRSSLELVAAVLDPVRPGREHLAAARRADLVVAVAVENLASGGSVRAQTATHAHDHGPLVAERELELLAGPPGPFSTRGSFRSA
jgi:hypothetical protein